MPTSSLLGGSDKFFYSATNDSAKGTLDVKLVNASSDPQDVQINITGAANIAKESLLITLAGNSTAETNSISSPKQIVPVRSAIKDAASSFRHVVPPYAIQVLELRAR